jgi:hypothetical protein
MHVGKFEQEESAHARCHVMRPLEVVLPVCSGAESGRTLTKAGQVYEVTVVVANCHLPRTLGSGMGLFSEQQGFALVREIFSRDSWVRRHV